MRSTIRLADFILSESESILADWEAFARDIWPSAAEVDPAVLRDHAAQILQATARDMQSDQTPDQRASKSRGHGGRGGDASDRLDDASDLHAIGRAASGFQMPEMIAEYRALRASVLRLWRASHPAPDDRDLDDIIRFGESIDQSITEAVRRFSDHVDRTRIMFLAILAHDLRNPLAAAHLSGEALAAAPGLSAEDAALATQVQTSAAAMGGMIQQLLDFARSGLGDTLPVSAAPADLRDICREVIAELRAAHPGCDVRLVHTGDPAGTWDAGRLRQAVSNLVANAIQHGPIGCIVAVRLAGDDPDHVTVAIHNPGDPIDPDALPLIFEPLARGPRRAAPRAQQAGSIGLGLYIARAVANAHAGTLSVTSTAAEGTTFTIRLPRHPPNRAPTADAGEQ